MRRTAILASVIALTMTSGGTSIYLANIPNPTETQKELANTCNTITLAGTTAIIGLLEDNDKDQDNDDDENKNV
jgi:hypothetical protein